MSRVAAFERNQTEYIQLPKSSTKLDNRFGMEMERRSVCSHKAYCLYALLHINRIRAPTYKIFRVCVPLIAEISSQTHSVYSTQQFSVHQNEQYGFSKASTLTKRVLPSPWVEAFYQSLPNTGYIRIYIGCDRFFSGLFVNRFICMCVHACVRTYSTSTSSSSNE